MASPGVGLRERAIVECLGGRGRVERSLASFIALFLLAPFVLGFTFGLVRCRVIAGRVEIAFPDWAEGIVAVLGAFLCFLLAFLVPVPSISVWRGGCREPP